MVDFSMDVYKLRLKMCWFLPSTNMKYSDILQSCGNKKIDQIAAYSTDQQQLEPSLHKYFIEIHFLCKIIFPFQDVFIQISCMIAYIISFMFQKRH